MTKQFLHLLFILLFASCVGKSAAIKPVELADVDSIKLIPQIPDDTISEPPIILTTISTRQFITDLNKARLNGLCKYYPFYSIIIYLKNGTRRNFRANGQNIKERSDECFIIGDENYFADLYKSNKKTNN